MAVCIIADAQASDGAPSQDQWWNREIKEAPKILTTDELRSRFHDLATAPLPATFHGALHLGVRMPYYLVGGSLEANYFPWSWLRLSAMVGMGATPRANPNNLFSVPAVELWTGIRLLGRHGYTEIDVPPVVGRGDLQLRAQVPSYFGFYLEGGLAYGVFARNRCTAFCDTTDPAARELEEKRLQLWMHAVGLRFLYQRHAASKKFDGSAFRSVELFAQYFFEPVRSPEYPLYDNQGELSDAFDSGFRAGVSFPLCRQWRCAQLEFAAGVSPARWLPFAQVGLGLHFWPGM